MIESPRPITPRLIVDGYARRVELVPTARTHLIEVTTRHYIVGDVVADEEREDTEMQEVTPLKTVDITSQYDAEARLFRQLQRDTTAIARAARMAVDQRILEHLDWLHRKTARGGMTEEGQRIVKITHTDLAIDVSSTRETVTKEMQKLQREGSIALGYGKVILLF